jgi:hypothetical protein
LINLKKKKNKQKTKVSSGKPTGENKIIANNKNQQIQSSASEKKPAITRKPIIITKNEAKK